MWCASGSPVCGGAKRQRWGEARGRCWRGLPPPVRTTGVRAHRPCGPTPEKPPPTPLELPRRIAPLSGFPASSNGNSRLPHPDRFAPPPPRVGERPSSAAAPVSLLSNRCRRLSASPWRHRGPTPTFPASRWQQGAAHVPATHAAISRRFLSLAFGDVRFRPGVAGGRDCAKRAGARGGATSDAHEQEKQAAVPSGRGDS